MSVTVYRAENNYGNARYYDEDICGFVANDGTVYRAENNYGNARYYDEDICAAAVGGGGFSTHAGGAAYLLLL